VDLGWHLEGEANRRQRGNDGAVAIGSGAGEEVTTLENTDCGIGPEPLVGEFLQIGQVWLSHVPASYVGHRQQKLE